ncbi:MAG TPA: hypothetical protein VEA41_12270 [Salinarimonas sp.]|nr:hypothetical protein [Salinarimonas sp.]
MLTLLVVNLKSLITLPLLGVSVLLAVVGVLATQRFAATASEGMELLLVLSAAAAVVLGATIYSSEQFSGTFELLWLATGSEQAMLRLKLSTLMIGYMILVLPGTWLVTTYLDGLLPFFPALLYLALHGFFILVLMAFIGTYVPQTWAAFLIGAAVIAAIYVSLHGSASPLSPFLNPRLPGVSSGAIIANRALLLIATSIILNSTGKRLRLAFQG